MCRFLSSIAVVLFLLSCSRSQGEKGGVDVVDLSAPPDAASAPTTCRGLGLDDDGCYCPGVGASQPCWPGDPLARGRGDCSDGIQTCVHTGEFNLWSACEGYHIGQSCVGVCTPSEIQSCKTGLSPDDGTGVGGGTGMKTPLSPDDGTGVAGAPGSKPNLSPGSGSGVGGDGGMLIPPFMCATECSPSTVRWCDEPVLCRWGKQTCDKTGYWGLCVETNERPGGCMATLYDQQCCANAGACCQDMINKEVDQNGHLIYPSIGQCANIATTCM